MDAACKEKNALMDTQFDMKATQHDYDLWLDGFQINLAKAEMKIKSQFQEYIPTIQVDD